MKQFKIGDVSSNHTKGLFILFQLYVIFVCQKKIDGRVKCNKENLDGKKFILFFLHQLHEKI